MAALNGTPRRARALPALAGALVAAVLAACASAPTAPALPDAGPALAPPPAVPYNAATTYAKLIKNYPFIRTATDVPPPAVAAAKGITYIQRGDHALQLDVYRPAQAGAPLPAVVYVHGGGWINGDRAEFAPMAIRMAERGFVGVTVSYRLAPEARYPAAIHDVKSAVRWVRAHAAEYGIDPQRIAIAGGSAGGQIASLVGVTSGDARFDPDAKTGAGGGVSSAVQAIVNIDGLSDFTSESARSNEDNPARQPTPAAQWFGGTYAIRQALWRDASPTFHVSPSSPPILFVGSGQPRFSVGREEMIAKLDAVGVKSRVFMLPDTPHSFWLFDPWLDPTVDATVAFLREQLRSHP
jgi:acetyl esterase/lipase